MTGSLSSNAFLSNKQVFILPTTGGLGIGWETIVSNLCFRLLLKKKSRCPPSSYALITA